MPKIFKINLKIVLVIFIVLDLFCIAMGMGVPIFCILFGFPIGWYIVKRITMDTKNMNIIFKRTFFYAIITSLFTFLIMSIIWGNTISMLFNPSTDFKNYGIPLILYDPKLSFMGWIILMIFISPFLQLLTIIFAAYLTLLRWLGDANHNF
jgi:hypothetical protein